MIRTIGITKSYGELKVLKGIDIEIKEKEVVSIVGASGAGKPHFFRFSEPSINPTAEQLLSTLPIPEDLEEKLLRLSEIPISDLYFSFTSSFQNSRQLKMSAYQHI
jgi:lipoprotein-releasing system ATP-binding protein